MPPGLAAIWPELMQLPSASAQRLASMAAQSADCTQASRPPASWHSATPERCLSKLEGLRYQVLPFWSATSRAAESTRPCRACDIMTDKILASSASCAVVLAPEVRQAAFFQPGYGHPVELLALADVPGEEVEPRFGQQRIAVADPDPDGDLRWARSLGEQVGGPAQGVNEHPADVRVLHISGLGEVSQVGSRSGA
jgi:hypothetical protein